MTGSFSSGLGSQLSVGAETTYGTPVTTNRFMEFTSESMKLNRAFLKSQQLRAGRMYTNSTRRSPTTRSAAGAVTFEVPSAGMGPWFNLLHGNVVTPALLGSGAYQQVHNIGTTDPSGKSVTMQIGKPSTGGTVNPFTYPGTVAPAMSFDCQTGGFLTCNATLDTQDEQTAVALAVASYISGLHSFNFTQCTVSVNGVVQPLARGINIGVNEPRDVGRFYLGATTKATPLTNAYNTATAALTVDFGDLTLYGLFAGGSVVPVIVTFVGPVIGGGFFETLTFTMAACGLDGDSPVVNGPGVLQQQIQLDVLDNGTNAPVVISYTSVDVTL